jgi:hypothetical protein
MAGSGGGFFSGNVSPAELVRRTRQAQESARDDNFETQVNTLLASELAQYNDRDIVGTNAILETFKSDLKDEIEGTVDLLFGGSIARHTYVDGLSDVDALVLLNRSEIAGKQPDDLKEVFANCLRARYGDDAVDVGTLAVTLNLHDRSIQLLPGIRDGNGFKIANSNGQGWSRITPREFAQSLTRANTRMNDKLVPCIKLAKAIITKLPEQRRITGYHAESLAIKVFKQYDGPKTTKAMLRHFFEQAAVHVRQPITDSSGQSVHVDEYLGPGNSPQRRIIGDAMGRIARRIKNADGSRSVDRWRELFE